MMAAMPQNRVEDVDDILKMRVIAVVGCSDNPERPSNQVASYLKDAGYRVIPVNPRVVEVLGEKCYPSLLDVPEPVEAVDVFRRSEHVLEVVEEAIRINAKAVWLQDGVTHPGAEDLARKNGLRMVADDCIMRQHLSRLGR